MTCLFLRNVVWLAGLERALFLFLCVFCRNGTGQRLSDVDSQKVTFAFDQD